MCDSCSAVLVSELDRDLGRVERVQRNQGWVLLLLALAAYVLVVKLARKGVLSYGDVIDA
ncbi:MAG TPA: hypothetical protein VGG75_42605 [Trebonia sp.]|jgi:hypothetical protein